MLHYYSNHNIHAVTAMRRSPSQYLPITLPEPTASQPINQKQGYADFISRLSLGVSLILVPSKKVRQEVMCHIIDPLSCVIYLQRNSNPMILIDVGSCEILSFNLKYEVAWRLENEQYLILRENTEDYILLFATPDEKLWFLTNLMIMKQRSSILTADDNEEFAEPFSLFRKYSSRFNTGNYIRHNQFLQLLVEIGYSNVEKTNFLLLYLHHNSIPESISIRGFQTFLRLYYCKLGCYPVFQKYSQNTPAFIPNSPTLDLLKPSMTKQQFQNFLLYQQHESQSDVLAIIGTVNNQGISYYQFCKYIFSRMNDCCRKRVSPLEMNQPLNHYYSLSSHNSYLIGNQLTSKAKRRRYIQDLENGYRCIELDVHDSEIGPIINHQLTLTSSILFEDVIIDINRFSNSRMHTPIILSLETNCKPMGRYSIATILLKHFGSKILIIDKSRTSYPTLAESMNKIILKGHVSIDEMKLMPIQVAQVQLLRNLTGIYKASPREMEFHHCMEYTSCNSSGLQSKVRSNYIEVLNKTARGWMRVYPNGTNFFSENFSPILGLQMGVQLIAINSQNNDIWKLIFEAFFEETNLLYTGYCLKPKHLTLGQLTPQNPIKLIVQIVSGNNIRFNNKSFGYYVKMAFFGTEEDNILGNNSQLFIDVTNSAAGEEGVFTQSVPIVYVLKQGYFGFVVFQIPQYGRAAVSIKSLKSGYHTIKLLDSNLQPIPYSTLLIKTNFSY